MAPLGDFTTIDIRPEVHLADESPEKLDDMVRTLAFFVQGFERSVAINGIDLAWKELAEVAGDLWTEGLRDD